MNKRAIVGISLTVVAVTILFTAYPMVDAVKPIYPGLATLKVADNGAGTANYQVIAKGPIPTDGSSMAFGYGIITGFDGDDNPENVLALTTHLCAADSLVQGNANDATCPNTVGVLELLMLAQNTDHDDATWHAHVLDLKPAEADCIAEGSTLEVDIAGSLSNNISPDWTVTVNKNKVTVFDVPTSDLQGSDVLAAVDFGIVGLADGDTITNLCLI